MRFQARERMRVKQGRKCGLFQGGQGGLGAFVAQGPVDERSVYIGPTEHVTVLGADLLDPFTFDLAVERNRFDFHLFGATEGLQDLNLLGGQSADGSTQGCGVSGNQALGVAEHDTWVEAPIWLAQVEVIQGI